VAGPYASADDLRRAVHAPPAGSNADVDADLQGAVEAATIAIEGYTGTTFPDPVPLNVHLACLQLSVRFYTADDVARGVLSTELGTGFTGRWFTPELEALLIGTRVRFPVA
jgi:hypothetical protein